MFKKYIFLLFLTMIGTKLLAQENKPDTIPKQPAYDILLDPNLDIDELLNDIDAFLDSILAPRSYWLTSLSAGQGYFNYVVRTPRGRGIKEVKKTIWSPTLGYYDKSGPGITFTSNVIHDSARFNTYQIAISPSYDLIKGRTLATGISLTHYFTKRSVRFYTSPLENELNGYFLWRKSWLQPGISVNYGWGSKTRFSKRDTIYNAVVQNAVTTIRDVIIKDTATIFESNTKSIVDFSMAITVRHDFYWLNIFSDKDHIRLSPMLSLSAGTQKFGFNQTTGATGPLRSVSILNNTQKVSLTQKFQPLSMTLYLRSEYSFGKFFIQPQLYFDYYFPAEKNNLLCAFNINTGFIF